MWGKSGRAWLKVDDFALRLFQSHLDELQTSFYLHDIVTLMLRANFLIFLMMLNITLFVPFEALYRFQINFGPYPPPHFSQWCLWFIITFHALSVMDVQWNKYIILEQMKRCMFESFTIVQIAWLAVSTIWFVIKPR